MSYETHDRAIEKLREAARRFADGELDDCLKLLSQSEALELECDHLHETLLLNLTMRSSIYRFRSQFDEASASVTRAIAISIEHGFDRTQSHMYLIAEHGVILCLKRDYAASINALEKVFVLQKRLKLKDTVELLELRTFLIHAYMSHGEWQKSRELATKTYNLCKQVLGTKHPTTYHAKGFVIFWDAASDLLRIGASDELQKLIEAIENPERITGLGSSKRFTRGGGCKHNRK